MSASCSVGTWRAAPGTAPTAAFPGLEYLGRRAVPLVAAAVGEDVLNHLLVTNPARLLGRF